MSSEFSHSAKLAYHFGTVTTNLLTANAVNTSSVSADNLYLDKGSVTQGTSITTGVVLPKPVGLVRSFSSTLASDTVASFAAEHSLIDESSIIFASIGHYSGNGTPHVRVSSFSAGSCTFTLSNVHPNAALNGPVTIAYQIL